MSVDPESPQSPPVETTDAQASTPPENVDPVAASRARMLETLGSTDFGLALAERYGEPQPTEAPPSIEPEVVPTSSDDVLETSTEIDRAGDEVPEPTAEPESDSETDLDAEQESDSEQQPEPETTSPRAQRRRERIEAEAAQRQADISAAVNQALKAEEARRAAEAALAAKQAEDAKAIEAATALYRPEVDENQLVSQISQAITNGDWQTVESTNQLLSDVRAERQKLGAVMQAAKLSIYGDLLTQFQASKELPGVDPHVVDGFTDVKALHQHISDARAKVADLEWSAKLDQQKAEYETKLAAGQARLDRQKADYEARLAKSAGRLPTTELGGIPLPPPIGITREEFAARRRNGDYRWLAEHKTEIEQLANTG